MHRSIQDVHSNQKLRFQSAQQVFNEIYQTNTWGDSDSRSGPGSNRLQTELIRNKLPGLFGELEIQSLLDIPCGDFHWMKDVDLNNIDYLGADIVSELIQDNRNRFGKSRNAVRFETLDLMSSSLPRVDLIFCRDCLVHLSFKDIFRALQNICDSGSKFLLTTTFTDRLINADIITGQWRVLNLQRLPFELPLPVRTIKERCSEGDGCYQDKSLGLWEIDAIKTCLANNSWLGDPS